jgi:hypothetical protein
MALGENAASQEKKKEKMRRTAHNLALATRHRLCRREEGGFEERSSRLFLVHVFCE